MSENILVMSDNIIASTQNSQQKYKELLGKFSESTLKISKITWRKNNEEKLNGFVEMSIKLNDLGLTKSDITKFNKEIFSNYMIDFVGELIIRTNLNQFVEDFFSLEKQEYSGLVNNEQHLHFGAKLDVENKITYVFHCSLLQNLLTEEFKNHISYI